MNERLWAKASSWVKPQLAIVSLKRWFGEDCEPRLWVGDKPVILYPVVFGYLAFQLFSPDLPAQLTVSFLQLVPEEGKETE